MVHPHRRKEESSGDFLAKFPAQEKTKNAERPFLRPTSRPETGSPHQSDLSVTYVLYGFAANMIVLLLNVLLRDV